MEAVFVTVHRRKEQESFLVESVLLFPFDFNEMYAVTFTCFDFVRSSIQTLQKHLSIEVHFVNRHCQKSAVANFLQIPYSTLKVNNYGANPNSNQFQ